MNLEKSCYSRLVARLSSVSEQDCHRHSSGIQIRDYIDQVELAVSIYEVIINSADVYFGIKATSLSDALIKAVVTEITKNFSKLTLSDVEYAYERFSKQRTDWRNLTKSDLIEPIKQYSVIKMEISNEQKRILEDERIAEETKVKEDEFENNAINVYKASLGLGEWLGDIFQAKAIFNRFRGKVSSDKCKELQIEAVKKFRVLDEKRKLEHTLYTAERIYAQLIVEYGIENKIQI
jgi:hypothetical protein